MKKRAKKHGRWIVFALDVLAVLASYWIAFQLRFEFKVPPLYLANFFNTVLIVVLVRVIAFHYFGLYRGIWRYASMADLTSMLKAIISSQVFISAVILFFRLANFPRSVLIIDPVLTVIFIGIIRFGIRTTREWRHYGDMQELPRMLIFGAGDLGESILREVQRHKTHNYNIVGFLDDNPDMWKHNIHGKPIFGGRDLLPKIIDTYAVDEVVIAVNHSRGQLISNLMGIYKEHASRKVQFKTVPTISESLKSAPHTAAALRKIELSDLLTRKPVESNLAAVSGILSGKTVLITGAGGTIGAELCRQTLRFKPRKLLMLENHNTALFYIDREITELADNCETVSIAGDIRDSTLLNNVFGKYKPQMVLHSAAHKHVSLMESNPQEAIKNNTLGTHLLAEAAISHGVERFLFISTDKAVRPSSVMGVSKRLGEMMIKAMAKTSGTKFMSVRFGNVLGSSGSAVNIFKEQIVRGGPVTVTHPDVTRYFMTTHEAIQLVLQACAMGKGGELFVLNMGEPVKILDLARNLIMLTGLDPDKNIPIRFTGLKPGEKLFEELFRPSDVRKDTGHPDIFMAVPEEADAALLRGQMRELKDLCNMPDPKPLLKRIKELVPAYNPNPYPDKKASKSHLS